MRANHPDPALTIRYIPPAPRRLPHTLALLLAGTLLSAVPVQAQVLWDGSAANGLWNDGTNWTPAAAPAAGETAQFNGAGPAAITVTGTAVNIDGIQFLPGSLAYTFAVDTGFVMTGAGVANTAGTLQTFNISSSLTFQNASAATDGGPVDYSVLAGGTLNFQGTSTVGLASISVAATGTVNFSGSSTAGPSVVGNSGAINFSNTSSAGTSDVTNGLTGEITFSDSATAGGSTIRSSGTIVFNNTSTAGSSIISNNALGSVTFNNSASAGSATLLNGGAMTFNDSTTAATSRITNGASGILQFGNTSTAADATIINNDSATVTFVDSATAANATITNNGAFVSFANSSTAANSTIVNTGGNLQIVQSATAGSANITNDNGALSFGFSASADTASAGDATITNNGGSQVRFYGSSTAANAIITTNDGTVLFTENSTGGNAQLINGASGVVDISALTPAGMTAGSISGGGQFLLGEKQLSVGGNNLSTTVSGVIADGGLGGGVGGSLVKTGTGTLTLTGDNTYTGDTTISGGVLQLGNGGTTGSIVGNVIDNATFAINRSDSVTFAGTITGSGAFQQLGTGTTIFTADNSYAGNTLISAGTLQLGNGGASGLIVGNVVNNGTFAINRFDTIIFPGLISGTGAFQQLGAGRTVFTADNTYSGLTTISNGILQLGNGGTTGGIGGGDVVNNAGLWVNRTNQLVLPGAISGSGTFQQLGTGTTIFTGNNSYTGLTTISAGTLQIGNGGTTGAIAGDILDNSNLVFNRSNTFTYGGAISGNGAVQQNGAGTTTLTGVNNYTGATTVNAGTLLVNGSIVSATTVNAGGTLGGSGTLGSTTINGGTLSPGNSIGTITINGNLTFVGAGNYVTEVSPATADRTNVTGTATLAGRVRAIFAPGTYVVPKTYTILSAAGGRIGTFSGLDQTDAPAFKTTLDYTATDVLLNLTFDIASVTGLNQNQAAVAGGIQKAFIATGTLPPAFFTLGSLSAAQLPGALTQVSGEIGTGAATAAFQSMDQFLGVMLDPFLETRFGDGSTQGRALGFAPEANASLPGAISAYAGLPTKAPPPATFERRWTVWGAAYGAEGKLGGDATIGSNNLTVKGGSFAGGIDYRLSPDTAIGVAVAGGSLTYNVDGAAASGRSDVVQGGIYGSTRWNNAYLSGAFAYGHHDVTTDRTVTFPGVVDRLRADFDANNFGGRLEGGYRFAVANSFGVTPYAAVQVQRFSTPNYREADLTGLNAFALNYAGRSWNDTRSELGARVDHRTMLDNGALLILRARAAWAHDFDTGRAIDATFQALPGFGFTVAGASPAANAALVSAGAELKFANGVALRAKFDGEFASRSQVYGGSGGIYVSW